MIKSLKDARIVDGLPRILAKQPWVRALSEAMGVVHEMTMAFADHSQIYTDNGNGGGGESPGGCHLPRHHTGGMV